MTDHIRWPSWRKAVLGGVTALAVLGVVAVAYLITQGRQTQPDDLDSDDLSAIAFSDNGQYEEAEKRFRELWWQGDGSSRERAGRFLSAILAVQGQLEEAGEFYEDRRQYFLEEELGGEYLTSTLEWSLIDLFVHGSPQKGLERIDTALERVPWDSVPTANRPYIYLSMLYALAGSMDRARAILDEYQVEVSRTVRRTEENYQHGSFVHIARGAIAQGEGRVEDAMASYETMARANSEYQLVSLPMRALAREMAEDPFSAIELYEEYVDATTMFRTLTDQQFLGGSLFRLGSLYEELGDMEKAAYYYQRLSDLWKNADAELQHRVRFAQNKVRELTGTG